MIRRACGLALLAAALALGVAHAGSGTRYSGITTMTFQQGVSPTADYAGCEDTFLKQADSGRDFGGNAYLRAFADDTGTTEQVPLIKFDISALPDSAIILRARLWFYQTSAVAGGDAPSLHVYRLYYPWTEGSGDSASSTSVATWTTRVSGSNWSTAGAKAELAINSSATWQASASDTATVTTAFAGSDTLNHVSAIGAFDRPADPITKRTPRAAAATNSRKGWFSIDITHQAELWHAGANTNNGVVIVPNEDGYASAGILYWCSSEFGYKLKRPKLEITYFDPTSGSSGSSGRRIIGPVIKGVY